MSAAVRQLTDIIAVNEQLAALYLESVRNWRELRFANGSGAPELSAPHLVEAPASYATATARLMIVGQESLGWGEGIDPLRDAADILAELREWYRTFALGAHYKSTPFWQAANQVFASLNPSAVERSYLWSNLYKMDVGGKRPPLEREAQIADIHLLPAEIRTFSPDVVVFFTGPQYERRLLDTFPGATFTHVSRIVSRVSHEALPTRTFRTYHPKYLRLSRNWSALDDLVSACRVA